MHPQAPLGCSPSIRSTLASQGPALSVRARTLSLHPSHRASDALEPRRGRFASPGPPLTPDSRFALESRVESAFHHFSLSLRRAGVVRHSRSEAEHFSVPDGRGRTRRARRSSIWWRAFDEFRRPGGGERGLHELSVAERSEVNARTARHESGEDAISVALLCPGEAGPQQADAFDVRRSAEHDLGAEPCPWPG